MGRKKKKDQGPVTMGQLIAAEGELKQAKIKRTNANRLVAWAERRFFKVVREALANAVDMEVLEKATRLAARFLYEEDKKR